MFDTITILSIIGGFIFIYLSYKLLFKASEKRGGDTKKQLLQARLTYFDKKTVKNTEKPIWKSQQHQQPPVATPTTAATKQVVTMAKEKSISNENVSQKVNISSLYQSKGMKQPEVKPLSTLQQLMEWMPGYDEFSIANIQRKNVTQDSKKPKTLICHDMKGGYLEDRFTQGYNSEFCYHLHYWNLIDTFCYFSHHFVTIPPPCWTNAAHVNGVKCLGTLITEWNDGAEICLQIFQDAHQVEVIVNKLVDIAEYYQFDGWLINIENPIKESHVKNVVRFLSLLTNLMHKQVPASEVIWYDSVVKTGQLSWQNKLCSANRMFFDQCDGIFLNYTWTIHDLQESIDISGAQRQHDVYVGVDVFGRGCFGGGGWNTYKALQVIRDKNLSSAIFAPGWVMEKFGEENFDEYNKKFWELLTSYLYPHYICRLPLFSSFCRGYGKDVYMNGEVILKHPWTNLSVQSLQPTFSSSFYQLGPKTGMTIKTVDYCKTDAYNGGGCLQISGNISPQQEQTKTVFRTFKTDVTLAPSIPYMASYTFKTTDEIDFCMLFVFGKNPVYMVFGTANDEESTIDSSFTGCKRSLYTVPEDQEENYIFVPNEVKKDGSHEGWRTRHYKFSLTQPRVLQEIRFACVTKVKEKCENHLPFTMKIGEVRICEQSDITSDISPAINIRCSNVDIVEDEHKKILTFVLRWDHRTDGKTKTAQYYDIYCESVCDQEFDVNMFETSNEKVAQMSKNSGRFIGRSLVESYYVSNVFVPKVCAGGLKFTIQSVTDINTKTDFSKSGHIILTW